MKITETIIKTLKPSTGMALKNPTSNNYAMSVIGVNVDDWVECPIEEYNEYQQQQEQEQQEEQQQQQEQQEYERIN